MENHIKLLAETQAQRGHEVTVLATHQTGKTHVETTNKVRVMKAGRIATVASTPISLTLPLLLSKEKPDIAHLHSPYPIGELSQLCFGQAKKVVLTYHSDIVRQKRLLILYKPFLKRVLSKVGKIIATSDNYVKTSPYLCDFTEKCAVIPLGIDVTPFLQSPPAGSSSLKGRSGSPIILFVGKLRYYKGLHFLLQAMTTISGTLLVIGSGPMETEWKSMAESLGILNKVIFLGEKTDEELLRHYHAADIFVLPSCERSEAFGLVQVEAMASGLPVVSTELGTGTSFVNRHMDTGLVVPPKDPQALSEAIQYLHDNPSARHDMGKKAQQRAIAEFSHGTMVERILNLYENL